MPIKESTVTAGSAGNGKIEVLQGRCRSTSEPDEFQDSALVRDRIFLTLPRPLLAALDPILGANSELLKLEYELSDTCGDHTQHVGFWRNNPIVYPYLRRAGCDKRAISEAALKKLGWAKDRMREILKIAEERLEPFAAVAKGYAGWLMLHPPFLDHHDRLLKKWDREISHWGFPRLGRAAQGPIPPEFEANSDDGLKEFSDECEQFLLHWRLAGLAAPNLPVPLTPQTPAPAPIFATGPMSTVGAIFYLPDTFPVPTRDVLRGMLEDSLRGDGGRGHLKQWTAIVRLDNAAKNQIDRYGRLFELQHYQCILYQRHRPSLKGKIGELELAFAGFLECSDATIHKDLAFIRQELGPHAAGEAVGVDAAEEYDAPTDRNRVARPR